MVVTRALIEMLHMRVLRWTKSHPASMHGEFKNRDKHAFEDSGLWRTPSVANLKDRADTNTCAH